MPEPNPQRVSCPACGKGYRWDPSIAGRSIACKKCGEAFTIPDQPEGDPTPTEATPQAGEREPEKQQQPTHAPAAEAGGPASGDAGVYELADHPDDEAETASANAPATASGASSATSTSSEPADAPEPDAQTGPPESAVTPEGGGEDAHEPKHLSEAAKAARREQQRIAAAEAQAQKSWRDYKWPIILVLLVCILVLIILAMFGLSDLLDGYVDVASRNTRPLPTHHG